MNIGSIARGEIDVTTQQKTFLTKVYGWMSLALILTGLMAFYTVSSKPLLNFIFSGRFTFFGLIIGELLLVGYLSVRIQKMSAQMATGIFIFYSLLNGLTLSSIFLVYTSESIATTFFVTGGTFGIMSLYGLVTKTDLSRLGNLLFMGLIGVVLASIVNFFLKSTMLYWLVTYVGIAVFVGLIAYDTQKIKKMAVASEQGYEVERKAAIMGALALYLDFINLFLLLLRIFGRRR